MKKLLIITLLAVVSVIPASVCAQVRFGVKGGVVVSKLSLDKSTFDTENRAGFSAGLQVDLSLPLGFALDASVLYSHRNDAFSDKHQTYRRDYIEIPLHLRYGINLVGVNQVLIPYVFTGPNFAMLCNESPDITWDNRSTVTSWDVGFGVELLKHVQIQACYGIGMTDAFKYVGVEKDSEVIKGKDRCWTVTAAYLF